MVGLRWNLIKDTIETEKGSIVADFGYPTLPSSQRDALIMATIQAYADMQSKDDTPPE